MIHPAPPAADVIAPAFEQAIAQLRAAGLRVTEQRRALIRALIQLATPTAIETIHAALPAGTCDLVTVYRSLDAFENAGVVRRIFSANGTALLSLATSPERFHVVARDSHRTEVVSDVPAELFLAIQLVEDRLRASGFKDVGHVVQFFAIPPSK